MLLGAVLDIDSGVGGIGPLLPLDKTGIFGRKTGIFDAPKPIISP